MHADDLVDVAHAGEAAIEAARAGEAAVEAANAAGDAGSAISKSADEVARVAGADTPKTLYHYTDEKGLNGILSSNEIRPSTAAANPKDVRYGDGQYLSDIIPGTKTQPNYPENF